MNKRHYEHTLPNIRGSLSNTYEEKRCTLLQYPVKLGTRSAESCTKVFVIL